VARSMSVGDSRRELVLAALCCAAVVVTMLVCDVCAQASVQGPNRLVATAARARCAHLGPPGVIGGNGLISRGWTTGEVDGLTGAFNRFAKRICPAAQFIDIDLKSYNQTHVNDDTVWKYVFRIKTAPGQRYKVTAYVTSTLVMAIGIRSMSGRLVYHRNHIHTS
jgi:hypothetical protein